MYCPIYINLSGKKCIVVGGGGKVACAKMRILLKYGAEVVLISPEVNFKTKDERLSVTKREHRYGES